MRLAQWVWNWLIVPVLIAMIVGAVLIDGIKHKIKRAKK